MKQLWVDKYRPETLDGYVFVDENQKDQVEHWISTGEIPHLLLSGSAGTGKTTLAKILINMVGIQEYDLLEINASKETSVDVVRDKIDSFVTTSAWGDYKIVLLDEFDYLSRNAQGALRSMMETTAGNARFILTCNFPHKVITAIHSRCQGFHVNSLNEDQFYERIIGILTAENIPLDESSVKTLETYVKSTYPDLRKCINLLQANSVKGKLVMPSKSSDSSTHRVKAVELFKKGKIREARELLCKYITPTDIDEIFRWMYDNLDLWSDTEDGQDKAICLIRDGLANAALIADPEINLSATLIELCHIRENEKDE